MINLADLERREAIFKLREMTGAGIIDCKNALEATHYVMEEAKQWLKDRWILGDGMMCNLGRK